MVIHLYINVTIACIFAFNFDIAVAVLYYFLVSSISLTT